MWRAPEAGDILPVCRGPAFRTFADIGSGALLTREFEQISDQPGFSVSAMHLRQPYRHRAHPTRRVGQTSLLGHARNMRTGIAPHIFGDHHTRRDEARSGGDDERLVRAYQHIAHGFDGGLVDRTILREFREIMDEGQMDHAVRVPCAALQAFEVLQRAAMDFRAQFPKRPDVLFRAREADDLMPVCDQFLCSFGADKSGGAGDEYTHDKRSLFRAPGYATLLIRVK